MNVLQFPVSWPHSQVKKSNNRTITVTGGSRFELAIKFLPDGSTDGSAPSNCCKRKKFFIFQLLPVPHGVAQKAIVTWMLTFKKF